MRVSLRHLAQIPGQTKEDPVFPDRGPPGGPGWENGAGGRSKELHLTPIEFKLLAVLVRYSGKVFTHGQLLKEVWGHGSDEPSPLFAELCSHPAP